MRRPSSTTVSAFEDLAKLLHVADDLPKAKREGLVQLRLAAIGCGTTCPRCGGTGRHSFNGSHSICYECRGAGRISARYTEQALVEAQTAVAGGALDRYFEVIRRRPVIRRIRDELQFAREGTITSPRFDYSSGQLNRADPAWIVYEEAQRSMRPIADAILKLVSRLSQPVTVAEEMSLMPELERKFADWVSLRQAFARRIAQTEGYAGPGRYHWSANRDCARREAEGDPFACTMSHREWERAGRPSSTADLGA